jgi:flagellar biosynthesis protein FlhF
MTSPSSLLERFGWNREGRKMQYFTEQGRSHQEVDERVRMKYGDSARVLTRRTIHTGGFLGLFMREGIEVTGYIAQDAGRKRSADIEAEKQKILLGVKNDQTIQKVLEEVQSVKEMLGKAAAAPALPGPAEKHPACDRIETIMLDNDFSRAISPRSLTG